MTIDVDVKQARSRFAYRGRNFELRRNWDFEGDEVIVRYELFINGRELDLSALLHENDGAELDEYLALPYAKDGTVLKGEDFPEERLREFIRKIVERYDQAPVKKSLFL